ncbi:alpha amylase C-terminal domain-containing protein [Candidatus Poribacteria bacterium]|nr:alpha amylase C-terminal domain-containing protein [Candidatus Poribacteria bacterium]
MKRKKSIPLIESDHLLIPYESELTKRVKHFERVKRHIEKTGGILGDISQGHLYFGFNRGENDGQEGVWYREWAPGAHSLSLIGDFNDWNRDANPMSVDEWGIWHIFLPDEIYNDSFHHSGRVKVHVKSDLGAMDRIPAYIQRVIQEGDVDFTGQYWTQENSYQWKNLIPDYNIQKDGLRIYEAHIGMAQEEERVGTYTEFKDNILPRILDLGYNAIQLMAIMEHPYYGSFGYHVSSYFAVSSRFGTPEELKELIDTAHGMGLLVIMDLVHSHAIKNINEGLNFFDGTEHQYFHSGAKREHNAWDSLCFDYSKYEVQRFLLSNIRYWLENFRFDGFRFDGVTSMLYKDHGLGRDFTSYTDYFDSNIELDAIIYLMLANELLHEIRHDSISIAEDMSGMPGLARPIEEGGMGFDYRLAMGIPDYWIRLLKEKKDEEWHIGEIYGMLRNRRSGEKHIAYVESHDQSIVGDKTMAMQLMDAELYTDMSVSTPNLKIARGVALHKLIRLLTFSLGGEGYLNFIGNEFGHPEWIDFPRSENDFSYWYARRQWHLVDDETLYYKHLNTFDKAMQQIEITYQFLTDESIQLLLIHEDSKQIVFTRGSLVFAFNLHPNDSVSDWRIPVPEKTDYCLILNTDDTEFGGNGLIDGKHYPWQNIPQNGEKQSIQIYVPARCGLVFTVKNDTRVTKNKILPQ